jgi:tripartite-type tricarboxylate transporter receptor subunit TctC
VLQFIKTGKLRCIATGTASAAAAARRADGGRARLPRLRDDAVVRLLAPASMAKANVDKLAAASARAIKEPTALKLLENEAAIAVGSTPAEFAKFIEASSSAGSR